MRPGCCEDKDDKGLRRGRAGGFAVAGFRDLPGGALQADTVFEGVGEPVRGDEIAANEAVEEEKDGREQGDITG